MRLLIVVDKLLTGFDAPPAPPTSTSTRRCRTTACSRPSAASTASTATTRNTATSSTTATYSTRSRPLSPTTPAGALDGYEKTDIEGLLSDRIDKAREDLDEALERIRALCEPVEPPKNTLQYQQYFCATEQGDAEQLKANEPKRVELYKAVAALVRAYGALANEMTAAGYSDAEADGNQERDRALRERARRGEARCRGGRRLQAVRSRHAPPARHLHPGRSRPRSCPTSRTQA